MFEKEAEDYVNKNVPTDAFGYRSLDDVHYDVKQAYRAGAEFGYNKCKEELNQIGLALQSDMDKTIEQNIALKKELNKANEWHYVKDGDLPRQDGHTCFSIDVLANNKKWVYYEFSSGKWFCGNKEVKVIAWREIEFPNESK